VRIRGARPEEASLLTSLALESKAHWGYAPELLQHWRNELTISAHQIKQHSVLVAEIDEDVVGFYMLCSEGSTWVLEHLWIRPAWIRQRIGSRLIKHALRTASEKGATHVRVVAEPNAILFYERNGGVRVDTQPAPLPNDPSRVLPIFEFQPLDEAYGLPKSPRALDSA
jgi:molybdenum cofactor cytidylyltransferase